MIHDGASGSVGNLQQEWRCRPLFCRKFLHKESKTPVAGKEEVLEKLLRAAMKKGLYVPLRYVMVDSVGNVPMCSCSFQQL